MIVERLRWLLKVTFKSLARKKSRTFLLMISLTLASALSTVFLVFPRGARMGLGRELRAYGANLIVSPFSQEAGSAGLSLGLVADSGFLNIKALKKYFKQNPLVKEANFQLLARGYYQSQPVTFLGTEREAFQNASQFWKIEGRSWPEKGEVLAGSQIAKRFGWKIGQQVGFEMGKKKFNLKIVGIAESGSFEESTLLLDREALSSWLGVNDVASQVLLRVEPTSKIDFFEKELKNDFPELKILTLQQVVKREENIVIKVEMLLFLVTIFVMVATSISVANTTSITVVERWREIGLLKSIGGSNAFVTGLFLLEACFLAFFASLAGFFLGWVLTEAFALSVFSLWVPFDWWSMPTSFLASFSIVLVSSIWPLRLIFRVEPALVLKGQ